MLSDRDRAVLEFARYRWPRFSAGRRDEAIIRFFGMTPVRFHQVLVSLLERPEAAAYDPELVAHVKSKLAIREGNRVHARRRGFDL